MTPRSRYWARTSGKKVISGLLVGLGILILVVSQFLKSGSTQVGFIAGMMLAAAGVTGLIITGGKTPPP